MNDTKKWIVHRISGVILAPLYFWFYFSLISLSTKNYQEANFYDLESDPYELSNLIGINEFQPVIEDLRKRLINLIKRHENIDINVSKSKIIDNPGQLGLTPGDFMEDY